MRFHLKTQTFCCVFMSRPHENDKNDVSYRCFRLKTLSRVARFENASIGFVWTGRIHWKRKQTIGHVISVPSALAFEKIQDGRHWKQESFLDMRSIRLVTFSVTCIVFVWTGKTIWKRSCGRNTFTPFSVKWKRKLLKTYHRVNGALISINSLSR